MTVLDVIYTKRDCRDADKFVTPQKAASVFRQLADVLAEGNSDARVFVRIKIRVIPPDDGSAAADSMGLGKK